MGWLPEKDVDAIHDNEAGEISAITEKVTPIDDDLVIIEDSADSNSKKSAKLGNLPGGGGGGGGNTPEWLEYFNVRQGDETAHGDDDFFTDASKTGITETTVSGTATWTELRDRLSVKYDGQSSGDVAVALKSLTPNSAPVTIETAFSMFGTREDFASVGICFTDGTTASDNIALFRFTEGGTGDTDRFRVSAGTLTSFFGDVNNTVPNRNIMETVPMPFVYVRLVWTGSNAFAVSLSGDGVTWHANDATATFAKTMTPTHFGPIVSTNSGTVVKSAAFEYLRVYESDLS